MKEFRFTFRNLQTTLIFDEASVTITDPQDKQIEITYDAIRNWYTNTHKDGYSIARERMTWRGLIITYLLPDGKQAYLNLRADEHNLVFKHLVDWMAAEFPDKSLESLSEYEANKIMKIKNKGMSSLVYSIPVMWVFVFLSSWPSTIHMFDVGFANASVYEIAHSQKIGTRNIAVTARILKEHSDTIARRHTSEVYFPMVDSTWKKGDSILVVGYLIASKNLTIDSAGTYYAVINNIYGERIDAEIPDRFHYHDSLRVATNPVLVELMEKKPSPNAVLYVYIGLTILAIISHFFAVRKSKRKPKPYELVHGRD
jgi:hypothetical protein